MKTQTEQLAQFYDGFGKAAENQELLFKIQSEIVQGLYNGAIKIGMTLQSSDNPHAVERYLSYLGYTTRVDVDPVSGYHLAINIQ